MATRGTGDESRKQQRYQNADIEMGFGKVLVTIYIFPSEISKVPDYEIGMETINGNDYRSFSLQDGMAIYGEENLTSALPEEDWFEALDFLLPVMEGWQIRQREEFESILEAEGF